MISAAVLIGTMAAPTFGRNALKDTRPASVPATSAPAYCNTEHNIGRIALAISNDATLGYELAVSSAADYFTGDEIRPCEYPKRSRNRYLCGAALWIGAIVGTDTLVSTGADGWAVAGNEFHPGDQPMMYLSTTRPDLSGHELAVSEQDYIAVYNDTCYYCSGVTPDEFDYRIHIPLGLEVTQQSHAWSYQYADDFVLLDYSIRNIGTNALSNVYIGIYVDGDVHDQALDANQGSQDDFAGFRGAVENPMRSASCPETVDLTMGWIADNDGDLGQYVYKSVPNITGVRVLKAPVQGAEVSFNWWVSNGDDVTYDFGPQRRANPRDYRTGGGTGTPIGDRNKYYVLSNGDLDYDQVLVGTLGEGDSTWLPRPEHCGIDYFPFGFDTRYCLSFGPFELEPGDSLPLVLAYVGGMNFHKSANNLENLPYDPDAWYEGVDFDSLIINAIWADWVYDNPGFDSDGDGWAGVHEMCGDDTVWVKGDGVPDFRAAAAPDGPRLWVEAVADGLKARWNGHASETGIDWASRLDDFEGYRAYLSSTGEHGDYVLVAGYDIEDYRRFYWDGDQHDWALSPRPFTVEEAICYHAPGGCGDPSWHPMDYPRATPYVVPGSDSVFYFEPLGANAHVFDWETPFVKRFPDAPRPPYARPSDVPAEEAELYLTDDGYFKYYEYEYKLTGLVPGQTYWLAVTAFDFGSALTRGALESRLYDNVVSVVPVEGFTCCDGRVGNVDCSASETPGIADLIRLIDFMFVSQQPLCCVAEADINLSGGAAPTTDDITLGDIGAMIWYMYLSPQGLPSCM